MWNLAVLATNYAIINILVQIACIVKGLRKKSTAKITQIFRREQNKIFSRRVKLGG